MRVLVVDSGSDYSTKDVADGITKGLRQNGCEVGVFNLADRLNFYKAAHVRKGRRWKPAFNDPDAVRIAATGLLGDLYTSWPDVVVIVSGHYLPPDVWAVLRRRPHQVVLWCTESPYEDDRQALMAEAADTVLTNDPVSLDRLRAANPRTWYAPHAYDPDRHHPGPVDPYYACDFSFVGTWFPSRIEFFADVDFTGIHARLGGNRALFPEFDTTNLSPLFEWDFLANAEVAALYRSTKVGANLYRKEITYGGSADGVALGPREVEMAASGLFFLREPRAEGDELLAMLPTFETSDEFGDLLRWWLAHDDERAAAAYAARAAVADRTFKNVTGQVLARLDQAAVSRRLAG